MTVISLNVAISRTCKIHERMVFLDRGLTIQRTDEYLPLLNPCILQKSGTLRVGIFRICILKTAPKVLTLVVTLLNSLE